MTLTEFLIEKNYARIPLTKNGIGHFQTDGFLNERRINVLVDTGAGNTVFSLDLIEEMRLPKVKIEGFGGGVGAAQLEIFQIEDATFALENFALSTNLLLTMDLSHANAALRLKGTTPIEAILGIDVLEAHAAVIDYASDSLFLRS